MSFNSDPIQNKRTSSTEIIFKIRITKNFQEYGGNDKDTKKHIYLFIYKMQRGMDKIRKYRPPMVHGQLCWISQSIPHSKNNPILNSYP